MSMQRAVFLDRDGVLNRAFPGDDGKTHPPRSPEELEILPGVMEACDALRRAGFVLIVVSNQPDVARGQQRREVVETINSVLRRQVPIDDIRVCYHDNPDQCECRKPRPGLLLDAAREWGVDLASSVMVGDRWADIEAGWLAGCRTVLVDRGGAEAGRTQPGQAGRSKPDHRARSLSEAVAWILSHDGGPIRGGEGQ